MSGEGPPKIIPTPEEDPESIESGSELFPSTEQVMEVLSQLVSGEEYEVTKDEEDSEGLHEIQLWVTENDGSGYREYTYKRISDPDDDAVHSIDVAFFDENEIPYEGQQVGYFLGREWNEFTE